jgi:hypothetical protein
MGTNRRVARTKMLLATLIMSLLCVGTVQAQESLAVYRGQFTLSYRVHWGQSVLEPGAYTITIKSTGTPTRALIRKADGNGVALVVSQVHSSATNGVNALFIKDKDGQLTVHSLSLANLGMVLIYDPFLARESVQQARVSRTVPVMWVKK